jgi:hypothetical protein
VRLETRRVIFPYFAQVHAWPEFGAEGVTERGLRGLLTPSGMLSMAALACWICNRSHSPLSFCVGPPDCLSHTSAKHSPTASPGNAHQSRPHEDTSRSMAASVAGGRRHYPCRDQGGSILVRTGKKGILSSYPFRHSRELSKEGRMLELCFLQSHCGTRAAGFHSVPQPLLGVPN